VRWAGKPSRAPGKAGADPQRRSHEHPGLTGAAQSDREREERTIEGHHVHHARTGCLELSSSGMKMTSSHPVPSLPYHYKACRDPSSSRSLLFSGPSNTKTGSHFPHRLIPLLWRAKQGPPRSLHLPRQQCASQHPSIPGQQLSESKVLQGRAKTPP